MEERYGPFRIVGKLGHGGMGETFVAERAGPAGFAQRVCLKRLKTDESHDAHWVRMFQAEARLVATLHHQNIVSLFDFGQEGKTWWMALELVEGIDLGAARDSVRASGSRLPVDGVVYVATEISKALAYAHTRVLEDGTPATIVHRDVTPANVMISDTGGVLLTDFGIAKARHGERTRTGDVKGKVAYMSPEQSHGDPVDGRADLFALGVVMFELLAGARPFDGATHFATQLNTVAGKREDLRTLAPEVPERVVAIVDRLLEPDRERRYASADELLDAISELSVPANVVKVLGRVVQDARAARTA